MKTQITLCLCALVLSVGLVGCDGTTRLERGKTEIVLAPDASKSTRFAAEELKDFLSKVFYSDVPIATNVREGVSHVFVGSSTWAMRQGICTNSLVRDAFVLAADGKDVYIVGRDDPQVDTRGAIYRWGSGGWDQLHEHSTLFAVYEFLETVANVRMYFPGELGTIVPKAAVLEIPNGRRDVKPDFLERNYSWYADGVYFEGEKPEAPLKPERKVQYQRNRMQTVYIPCCHGANGFRLLDRFAESHPEYFVQNEDGTRRTKKGIPFEGHLCHTSKVWDEIYKDILSYARGDKPEVRGMGWYGDWDRKRGDKQSWSIMTFRRPWVDVMSQDGMVPCKCKNCQAEYTKEFHYATDLIWRRTVELAKKLKTDAPDIRITQMAYTPYRRVPAIDIPDNVDVMVAEGGPWSIHNEKDLAKQLEEIKAWHDKLGHKVWIWTYPGKYGSMKIKDVPDTTPRAYIKFYRAAEPYIFGAYAENEDDRWFYNHISNYLFGKFCWNTKIDEEAILEEYFRLMFGPAAKLMDAFVRELEDKWVDGVASRLVEGALGPLRQPPSEYDLFTKVYSPSVIRHWREDYFATAKKLVAEGSLEARRLKLYEEQFIDPLAARAEKYLDSISVEKELARRQGRTVDNWLVNGYMEYDNKPSAKRYWGKFKGSQWQGGWIGDDKTVPNVEMVKEAPAGLPRAMKITVKDKPITVHLSEYLQYKYGKLKPNTKYRFSIFTKLEDVRPGTGRYGGGVCFRIWDGNNTFYPQHKLTGTTDWLHHESVFTTPADVGKHSHTVTLYLWDAVGTVWFAGALLEEVKEAK